MSVCDKYQLSSLCRGFQANHVQLIRWANQVTLHVPADPTQKAQSSKPSVVGKTNFLLSPVYYNSGSKTYFFHKNYFGQTLTVLVFYRNIQCKTKVSYTTWISKIIGAQQQTCSKDFESSRNKLFVQQALATLSEIKQIFSLTYNFTHTTWEC